MTDKQLLKTATSFTKGLLGKRNSVGWCYGVSFSLQSYLRMCNFKTEIIEGEIKTNIGLHQHFWLKLDDGRILDATADQFNSHKIPSQMPRIYLGEKPKYYKPLTKKICNTLS